MSLHDARILTALLRAKHRITHANSSSQLNESGVVCHSCGKDHRSNETVNGIERFNPFHVQSGEHGGEFTTGGGEFDDHPDVKEENEAYQKELDDNKEYFKEQNEIADENYAKNVKSLSKEQEKEKKYLAKEHSDEVEKLKKEHEIESKTLEKEQTKEIAELREKHHQEIRESSEEDRGDIAESHKEDLQAIKEEHASSRDELKEEHRLQLEDMADKHRDERSEQKQDQKDIRQELKESYIEEKHELSEGLKEASAESKANHESRLQEIIEGIKEGRFSPGGVSRKLVIAQGKTSKASSAESILRHCLRALGFSNSYRQGALSHEQLLRLVEEIRLYGRAWLRHEAEECIFAYAEGERASIKGILRANSWVEGPGGYLIQQDSGFRHSIGRFFGRAKQFVRELILAATLAISGPAPLTGKELDGVDREAQKQEQFFDKFHQEMLQPREKPVATPVDTTSYFVTVEPAPLTPGQFVARAESYADTAWQSAQRINRVSAVIQGQFKFERRIYDPEAMNCSECPVLAHMGWQPIGTLPEIGEQECNGHCHCYFQYAETEDGVPHIQGKRGPMRAPSEVSILEETGEIAPIAGPP